MIKIVGHGTGGSVIGDVKKQSIIVYISLIAVRIWFPFEVLKVILEWLWIAETAHRNFII